MYHPLSSAPPCSMTGEPSNGGLGKGSTERPRRHAARLRVWKELNGREIGFHNFTMGEHPADAVQRWKARRILFDDVSMCNRYMVNNQNQSDPCPSGRDRGTTPMHVTDRRSRKRGRGRRSHGWIRQPRSTGQHLVRERDPASDSGTSAGYMASRSLCRLTLCKLTIMYIA